MTQKQQKGDYYKEKGNNYLREKKYQEAKEQYTLAINENPLESIYYANRSLAEIKLDQFELAEKANISEAMVKSIELSISWLSDKTLTNLAEALGIDIIRFFVPIALEEKEQNNLYNEIKSVLTKNFNNFLDEVIQKVKQ